MPLLLIDFLVKRWLNIDKTDKNTQYLHQFVCKNGRFKVSLRINIHIFCAFLHI